MLKLYFLPFKKMHIWLLAELALLVLFRLVRTNRALMNAAADSLAVPFRQAAGRLCALTDVSVMEVLAVLLVLAAAVFTVWSIAAVVRAKGRRGQRAYGAVLFAVCTGLAIWIGCCLLWGVSYWTDSFQDRSGLRAQPVAPEELQSVTRYFAAQLSAAAGAVERDENGLFAVSREEILAGSVHAYDGLTESFPFLALDGPGVKAMRFSRLMSMLDLTGVYCAFTGESNVNVDSPACLLPSTAAHELGHQRGFASEQECNFLAVLASTTCGDPAYAYSGWLMGYIYLGNALYSLDPEAYWSIRDALPEPVRTDLAYNNAYWAQFQNSAVRKTSNKIHDGILKSYGDARGIQSYGTVVDLLVTYYSPQS